MNAPQIILVILWTITITVSIYKHGQESTWNFYQSVIGVAINASLLWWGGFFG